VGGYGVISGGASPWTDFFSTFDDNPGPGNGYFYLVRLAGDCMTTSWQSMLGAEPGRDTASLGELTIQIDSPLDGSVLASSPSTVSGTVTGVDPIAVDVNGVSASVTLGEFSASVPLNRGINTITAMGTDAAGFMGIDQITVTLVDYSIPAGGMVVDSRTFTADAAVLDQLAFYGVTETGVPPGVDYTTLSVSRISATTMEVGFQIDVAGGTAPGLYSFQVEYILYDAGLNPLGPLEGNVFDFLIEVP
jgi:hypothetical protein